MQAVLVKNDLIESIKLKVEQISATSHMFNFNILYVPNCNDCALQLHYNDHSRNTRVYMLTLSTVQIHKLLNSVIRKQTDLPLSFILARRIMINGKRAI